MSKGTDHLLVRVLGPLEIDRRAADQPLTDRALRAVLSTLLVHANQRVSADALVEAAWPPAQRPARALDSLDARVGKLRTLLAPEAEISWSAAGCVLHLAPDRIDAVRFEHMIEAARWCPAPEAISTLDRALALWRGDPLPDLRRAGADHPEAVRLRQLRARAVEDLAARELETGKVADAAQRLLSLLSAEPLRERACGYAMWALHHLGMTADAVACYEQLRERLSDDLGEPTSMELDETFEAVTGRYPGSAHPGRPVPPGTTFVGRGHELARLTGLLDRERLVTVVGPGGVGKTRLVTETLSTATVGVTVVPLSTRDAGELPGAVAGALGIHTHDRDPDPLATVAEYLSGRRRVLVLDSCEHLLTEVRTLVRKLLGRCPAVTVLTTGRVRLGLAEECVLPLGPLARDGTRDPLDSKAGRLFLDRARTARPDFPADDHEADAARAVLRRIGCLPLTVELLAARVAA
ncbi:AfsR/SARP family transcriptional regulator, partial [Saccharomonospora iraqiensis]|uniref:AfsR/SARP family transcriptional regulator n=1 Tax=Saccharomonospora iraqiensis TaxID=52698 RepID=UPI00047A228D